MVCAVRTVLLGKKYGDFKALDNLSLEINKGEIYGLLGPNGAGKTTIIKILCGLLNPTSGEAYILDNKVPNKKISSDIGYMPQETALYSGLTIHQNIEFYAKLFGIKNNEIKEKEMELLNFVDLYDWRNEIIENLSGGMKHRVSLACTLIHNPKVIILDEPTVGVDPELRISFWNYFNKLKDEGVAILITTHYMDEAERCDRIGLINHGHLIAENTPKNLIIEAGTDSLEDAFLKFSRMCDR
ncbi:ABC transporter ATP-binding protein [Methanobrevibacter olleyae]|uniref:ABC transporter ATP-binding protein n=1 Tax=Methanobrevibacter olleyae TaxID=294671 RepID=A0A126QZS4_METOL|nr:ABC transporter ATP-binding protein [Methanobrevibacter olleyae]AMK15316.1 ABC transporter ATP-binding protein [Methanobrevibacter olleyae]